MIAGLAEELAQGSVIATSTLAELVADLEPSQLARGPRVPSRACSGAEAFEADGMNLFTRETEPLSTWPPAHKARRVAADAGSSRETGICSALPTEAGGRSP